MMDEFMKSLSDEQKALFLAALQGSMQPKNDIEGTTMPPHVKEEFDTPQPAPKAADDFTMRPPQRSGAVRATGENLFMDDGAECKGGENATPEYQPTKRTRRPPKQLDVRCSVCGKSFKKLQSLVSGEYHRCDRCCGGR